MTKNKYRGIAYAALVVAACIGSLLLLAGPCQAMLTPALRCCSYSAGFQLVRHP